jgi:uncharacterized spore protein YtfJ
MTLVERISDLAQSFGVNTAYGDPVEIEGKTLIPVAIVGYGFGGGGAKGDSEGAYEPTERAAHLTGNGEGEGAAGGGYAIPIGAYINGEDGLEFQPNFIAAATVAIPLVWAIGGSIAWIIRMARK